jgi:hypothetical protein
VTIPQSNSARVSLWYLDGRVAAAFLLMSGLLYIGYELTLGVPDVFSEPVLRLSLSAILAFGLVRRYSWAWWGSVLTGGLWVVLDFMRVSVTFALSGIDPRDLGTELLIICAFIAQAVVMALLLRMRTGLRPALTLGITFLGLLVVVLGVWKIGETAIVPGESDLGGPIYAAVVERVGIPAVKVVTGTVNGVKGIRIVIADSILSAQIPLHRCRAPERLLCSFGPYYPLKQLLYSSESDGLWILALVRCLRSFTGFKWKNLEQTPTARHSKPLIGVGDSRLTSACSWRRFMFKERRIVLTLGESPQLMRGPLGGRATEPPLIDKGGFGWRRRSSPLPRLTASGEASRFGASG